VISIDQETYNEAFYAICSASRFTVKTGGGAANFYGKVLEEFLELTDAAYVHGPQVPGIYPYSK